jgi:glyoxylase-like metal-dependent hydrolase (beta-lactamase superfamily II)
MDSNMYLVLENKHVFVVDPFICIDAQTLISKYSNQVDFIILTHEHYDHISGTNWLKELYLCDIICSKECGKRILDPKKNFSSHFDILIDMYKEGQCNYSIGEIPKYRCEANKLFEVSLFAEWQGHNLSLFEAPGHSAGSIILEVDKKILFVGDTLLKDYPTLTRFPGGS